MSGLDAAVSNVTLHHSFEVHVKFRRFIPERPSAGPNR